MKNLLLWFVPFRVVILLADYLKLCSWTVLYEDAEVQVLMRRKSKHEREQRERERSLEEFREGLARREGR